MLNLVYITRQELFLSGLRKGFPGDPNGKESACNAGD